MRTTLVTSLIFFSLAPVVFAQSVTTCNTDNFTIAQCQAACTGTWDSSNNTCSNGAQQTPVINNQTQQTPVINNGTNVTLINPLKAGTSLSGFLSDILKFFIEIGSIVVVLMLVLVGYRFVAAQGNAGEIEKARSMLLWTVIGALILLGAQAIAMGVQATVSALGG